MLKLFLWLRYLRKKKIVFLSIAAVALSVTLLIVVASLFTGFINVFEQSAVDILGDVVLFSPIKFGKSPLFIEWLERTSAVDSATAILSSQGLLHLGQGNVRMVEIWGIEPSRRGKVTAYKQSLLGQKDTPGEPSFEVADHPERVGGFVGIGVVAEPDEKTDEYDLETVAKMVGRQVVLTTGSVIEDETSSSETGERFKRRPVRFTIVDIVRTGVYHHDKNLVYLPIEELQKKLYPNADGLLADRIQIKLSSDTDVESALAQIRGLWQVFADEQLDWDARLIRYTNIETAKGMQRRYVAEFRKQMGVLLLIFGVVSFSAVVLIFCIFYMIARLKQRDIAIVKSCGSASSSVAFVFLAFGLCVGIVGSGIGAALAYIITKNVNVIEKWISVILGLKLWKSSVYMFSDIPNQVNWGWALPIVLFAVIAAALGTLIPAIVAARTRPVEILRYE